MFTGHTAAAQTNDELVRVTAPKVSIQAGRYGVVGLAVEVKDGYHIQAHDVKDEFIVPTTLSIAMGNDFVATEVVFPPARKFKLHGTEQFLDVYDGKFEIQISLGVSETIQKQLHRLYSELKYQACDSARCLFPRTVEFFIDVEVH